MQKIGIFSGTFDPPHFGHVRVVSTALQMMPFDQFFIFPIVMNPFKSETTSFNHRFEMAKLAFADFPVQVSDSEMKRVEVGGEIFTCDMLEQWKNHNLFFFMGADCLPQFKDWKNAEKLADMATFISIPRTGISSTGIRESLKQGCVCTDFVPQKVLEYIKNHELYKMKGQ